MTSIMRLLQFSISALVIWDLSRAELAKCDESFYADDLTTKEQYECLIEELFDPSKYSPLVRPVRNIEETLTVKFSVQLSQIITLDEKNQVMKTNVWLQLYWNDYQLVWDHKKRYKDVTVLRIRPEYVWRPDVVLFNNADGNYEVSYMSNTLVFSNGLINWIPPAIYKSSCTIDVEFFPFDEQVCDMQFGSWTFLDNQLNFTFYEGVEHLDVSDYLESGAWDIVEGDAEISKYPTGRNNTYKAMVTFRLRLRRKTLFYTVNLIIPCVLISFVTLSVFILPADAGEKITLCISILLALVVFLLLISKILPPSLTIPLISQYLLFTFIMNILAIISTVIVINRNYRTPRTHELPYWVRWLFLYMLPKLLLMKRPDHDVRWRGEDNADVPDATRSLDRSGQFVRNMNMTNEIRRNSTNNLNIQAQTYEDSYERNEGQSEAYNEMHHPNCRLNPPSLGGDYIDTTTMAETSFTTPTNRVQLSKEILKAAESVRFIHKHLKKDDEYHTVIDDWRYIALVLDRLLLCIFFIVTVAGSMGIFLNAPHILESVDQRAVLAKMNAAWSAAKSDSR
ncbi:Neuronal acetylcholine receptor subunit [Mactra antiquata]